MPRTLVRTLVSWQVHEIRIYAYPLLFALLQFKEMSDELVPTLRSIRQKEFYKEPRFHASMAWALMATLAEPSREILANQRTGSPSSFPRNDEEGLARPTQKTQTNLNSTRSTPPIKDQMRGSRIETIERFPEDLIPTLRRDFGETLIDPKVGTFEVTTLCVRIGKEVSSWKLGSS